MHENEGRGIRPGAPKNQQQERGQEESTANNSLVFPVEQKLPDKLSHTPAGEKKIENAGRTVFDCTIPKVVPSPFHTRRMLRDEIVTEEQAQELGQQWLEELKTMDRRSLEGEARWWEMMRDSFTKEQKQEEVQEIEQQLEVIRKQLRQR